MLMYGIYNNNNNIINNNNNNNNNNIIHLYSANLSHIDNDILLPFIFDISKKNFKF